MSTNYDAKAVAASRKAAADRYTGEYIEKDEWNVISAVAKEGPWLYNEMLAAGVTLAAFVDARAAFAWSCVALHMGEGRPVSEDALIRTCDEQLAIARIRAAKDEKFKPPYLQMTGEAIANTLVYNRTDAETAGFIGKRLVNRHEFSLAERELRNLLAESREWTASPESFVEHVQSRIMGIPTIARRGNGVKFVSDRLPSFLDEKYESYLQPEVATGVRTGFPKLDALTKGMQPGNLVVVAAGSGVGKSSFAVNVAAHVAREGKKALIFSLEMTVDEIIERLVWMSAEVDSANYYQRQMTDEMWGKISAASGRMQAQNIAIKDDSNITAAAIHAIAMQHSFTHGLDLVIVDYAQLLKSDDSSKKYNREQEVAAVSASLKRLANSLGVPVMVLSQLNDDNQVRESRALKFDASHLWILKKSDCQDGVDSDRYIKRYELFVEKGRNSADDATVRMLYFASQTRLEEEADIDEVEV